VTRGPTTQSLDERMDGLSAAVADFRLEATERFGRIDARFAAIEAELTVIRKLGTWLVGVGAGLIGTMIVGAATVAWSASAVVSDVRHQGRGLDRLEGRVDAVEHRLDAMDRKLDTLLSRTAKPAG
jgi:hypothetical protein